LRKAFMKMFPSSSVAQNLKSRIVCFKKFSCGIKVWVFRDLLEDKIWIFRWVAFINVSVVLVL